MVATIKYLIFYTFKFLGITFFIREVFQRNNVTILLYHDISIENATLHFSYLIKKYNIISLQDFIYAHKNNIVNKLPKKSLIITIDDGHKGNYKLLPLIKELDIPITIFACSHIIGTKRNFWFKYKKANISTEDLKRIRNKDRLNLLEKSGFKQQMEFEKRMALSKNEIIEMASFIDFQSHSMFHPCLPNCTNKEAEFEITNSKEHLEKIFNFKINSFSYPNGDYSERDIKLLKENGYEAGITCDLWFNNQKTNIYKLKRVDCRDRASLIELEVKVTGIFIFLKRLFIGKKFGYIKNRDLL